MKRSDLKNMLATVGFITTMLCTSTTPHMVRWYTILYVIYLVALWLGNDEDTTH